MSGVPDPRPSRAAVAAAQRQAYDAYLHAQQSARDAASAVADAQGRAAEAVEHARAEMQALRAAAAAGVADAQARQLLAEQRLAMAVAERDMVLRSTVWKASAPLRLLLTHVPGVRRTVRRSAKLAWYMGTFQQRRIVSRLRAPPPPNPAFPAPPVASDPPALPPPALPAPTLPEPLRFDPPPPLPDLPPVPEPPPAPVPGWPTADDKARVLALARAELDLFLRTGERIAFPAALAPAVSVVVVLWNAAELTLRCLLALRDHAGAAAEVVLVDNGSTDDTGALLAQVDGAVVLRHPDNAGFMAGCNRGVAASRGPAVLLLNSDAVLRPGTLPAALETLLSSETVGAVGARIVLSDGFLQEAGSILWSDGTTLGYGRGQPEDWWGAMFRRVVDYCSGAFLLVRRTTWDALGGFDQRFAPAYYEETDFCLRLAARGLHVVYEPRAVIDHFEFGSQAGQGQAHTLSVRNRKLFRAVHAAALHGRHLPHVPGNVLAARARLQPGARRLLIVDDLPPLAATGAGYPRALAAVAEAVRLGWAVTLYASVRPAADWDALRAELPWEVEIVTGPGAPDLPAFLQDRDGFYEALFVSRPGNMAAIRAVADTQPHLLWGVRVVYDAEALFTRRDVLLAALEGQPISPAEAATRLRDEVALAEGADAVACVSPAEAAMFGPRARVLGYPATVRRDAPGFAVRSGLLFVGSLAIQASPNWHGLAWFVRDVWPLVRAALPGLTLTVAGQIHPDSGDLAGPGIELAGPQPDLTRCYDRARVFVAPVRYAAGIPLKVIDAAASGVPCAGTPLMAELMDWQPGAHMLAADDPAALAHGIAALHEDPAAWARMRTAAQDDVAARFNAAGFRQTLAELLG